MGESLSLPAKIYVGVLEKRVYSMVEPRFQVEQSRLCPGHGTLDQLFDRPRGLEGA